MHILAAHIGRDKSGYRTGSALVALVLVILLVFIVYGIQILLKLQRPDPDKSENLPVWKEWQVRQEAYEGPASALAEQPKITKPLRYDANVTAGDTGEGRGEIQIAISPEGPVGGRWGGNYYDSSKNNFNGGGLFEGRTYPGKTYRDEQGEDRSKLYFLTKGEFELHKSDLKSTYQIVLGDIYVRGWIGTDYTVTSEIIITSDEKYFETFVWKSLPVNID